MKNQICSCKRAFLLLFLLLLGMPSFAQVQQEVPLFKSTRTFVHKAVWKDTVWTPGAIVDQIYFARYDKQGRISVENLLNPDGSAKTKPDKRRDNRFGKTTRNSADLSVQL